LEHQKTLGTAPLGAVDEKRTTFIGVPEFKQQAQHHDLPGINVQGRALVTQWAPQNRNAKGKAARCF